MNLLRATRCLGVAVLLSLAGCGGGDGLDRIPISGTVEFESQAVQEGQIRFVPEIGTASPVVIEVIENGRYATTNSGGVPAGQYRVEILAFDPAVPTPQTAEDPPRRQLLPAKYNNQTELRLTVEAGQPAVIKNYELTR